MKEPEILSVPPLDDAEADALAPLRPRGPFDACRGGVALRIVLFVQGVGGIAAMFPADGIGAWLVRWAFYGGAMLPPTLAWLLLICSLGPLMKRSSLAMHYLVGGALGAAAGMAACATLVAAASLPLERVPWFGATAAGILLAIVAVAGMTLRARGHNPAESAARLAELQARIRPHFLFNTLNSAIALVREEPVRAELLLEDLAELFRRALMDPAATVTLAEECDLARRYLRMEQIRFGDRMQVEWALDPAAAGALLPPLLLQPLVENAVIYGVESHAGPARLRVESERRGQSVILRITNTVPAPAPMGPPCRAGHGIALANVRDRLFLMHDLQSSFRAERKGDLFHVRLRMPA